MSNQKKESTKENSYISHDIELDTDIYILGGVGGIKSDEREASSKTFPQNGRYGKQAGKNGIVPSDTLFPASQTKIPIEQRKNFSLTARQVLEGIPIDLTLQTSEFLNSWGEWIDYRLEVGRKHRWATTLHCFKKFMNKCIQWGPKRSIAAIDHSIEMGYRGLFEPRSFDNPDTSWKDGTCL